MLAYEEPFEAAIVDLRYVQTTATGLTALATLRQLSPATKTIISTTDEEENRLLYLLAAFQFFEPRALLAKRADAFVTRTVVEAIGDRTDLVVVAQSFGGFTAPLVADRLLVESWWRGWSRSPVRPRMIGRSTPASVRRCGNRPSVTGA